MFNSVVSLCVKYCDKSFADVNFHHFINSMLKKDWLIFTEENDWSYTQLVESWQVNCRKFVMPDNNIGEVRKAEKSILHLQ